MPKRASLITCFGLFVLYGCQTWRGDAPSEQGLTQRDLGCAATFFVGEPPHPGMPLVPMKPDDIRRVARRIARIPGLREASSVSDADIVISAIFVPSLPICTHCEPKPATEWTAILEKGGPSHQAEYRGIGPFLVLTGHVIIGTDAVGGFAKQLAAIRRDNRCVAAQ